MGGIFMESNLNKKQEVVSLIKDEKTNVSKEKVFKNGNALSGIFQFLDVKSAFPLVFSNKG